MKYEAPDYNQMATAVSFLEQQPINDASNPVLWCLHQIIWHHGLDRVRWINYNKDFISRIVVLKEKDFLFDDGLRQEFQETIDHLVSLRR